MKSLALVLSLFAFVGLSTPSFACKGANAACTSNSDCCSGMMCTGNGQMFSQKKCYGGSKAVSAPAANVAAPKADGAECAAPTECASGHCNAGHCGAK
ncbi:hypothetical protein K2X33_02125 [bacterium]|nr:hypothetical protein [bacterium]